MCSRKGLLATGTIGLGTLQVRGRSRKPSPPTRMTAFTSPPRLTQASLGSQGGCLVGSLPRQVKVLTPEVPVGGGLLVDRMAKVQVLDYGPGAEIEMGLDEFENQPLVNLGSVETLE